LIGSGHVLGG